MNTRVIAIMSAQHGLITRRQAVEAGMAADQIDRLVRRKLWTVVRKGVYAETTYVDSLTRVRDQRLLFDRAASMRIRSSHIHSHHSSAYLLDLDVLHERPVARTHVTRPGIVGSHHRHGVTHHRAPYDEVQVVERDGLRCFGPARTACDISRDQGYLAGRVAAESALRTGTAKTELESIAKGMTSWPYVTVVNDVNTSASPETDSAGETLSAELVASLGFGVPALQFGLTAEGRTAWCDLRLGRHVFEFDGRVKYLRVDEGGFASESADEVVWFEKKRQDWVCGFKLGMSRLVWEDAFTIVIGGIQLERAQARLRREYLDTCQRFGTDVSDLASYLPRGERPRPKAIRLRAA
jgi:hypothetical protein